MNGLSVVSGLSVCIQDRLLGFIIQHQVSVKGNRHKPDLKICFWCVYIP